jgi:hypothetical protein
MAPASIPLAQIRTRLLRDGLSFVRAAQRLPGVVRIALIGSLASPKQAPKDIDFLVFVADACDLLALANAGRRLKGRTQSYNCGADIFLADEDQRYIGRICHWKECRPGVRASCDSRHCGRRAFLHDDLDDMKLDDALVRDPPIELWPRLRSLVTTPADVEQVVFRELRANAHAARPDAA